MNTEHWDYWAVPLIVASGAVAVIGLIAIVVVLIFAKKPTKKDDDGFTGIELMMDKRIEDDN